MFGTGQIKVVHPNAQGATLECELGTIQLTFYRDNIAHVAFFPNGKMAPLPLWGITAKPDESLAVTTQDEASKVTWSTEKMTVMLDKSSKQFAFKDETNRPIMQSLFYGLDEAEVAGEATYHVQVNMNASSLEHVYGLGQHQQGWMDLRQKKFHVWHDYHAEGGEVIAVPFVVSPWPYGFIFDNPSRVELELCEPGLGVTRWWAEAGDAVSFFVITGRNTDAIYAGYQALTGAAPLPPVKALGYIQCKQRYASQAELLKVARTMREKGYPADYLVVDWFHWKNLGDLDLDPEAWPDPAAMNAELASLGFDSMISVWPRFTRESRYYELLEKNGWLMHDQDGKVVYGTADDPRGAVIDTTHPAAAAWLWERVRDNYLAKGFKAFWLDEDEPDVSPHPYFLKAGSGARVHNLYPLLHTQAIYDGFRRDARGRCLILSRSAYLGAQRNGTTFWSSDIYPTWDAYRRQIPAGLNFCATGLPYWSSDIGGWQALPGNPQTMAEIPQDYPELYTRWFQFGAFCPTFRAHGTRPENEPWSYGPKVEVILAKYLKLRYRLLPYIYSLAFHTYRSGAPFMRALFMDFPMDSKVMAIKDEYMFGPAFLVAPVTEPGKTSRPVYLPEGTLWYDYWTGASYWGGQTIEAAAPIDTLPLFVRAGSIIPMGEDILHADEKQTQIELQVYAGADGAFDLYRDDGSTYAYEREEARQIHLEWNDQARKIAVENDQEGLFNRPLSEWLKVIGA